MLGDGLGGSWGVLSKVNAVIVLQGLGDYMIIRWCKILSIRRRLLVGVPAGRATGQRPVLDPNVDTTHAV